MVVLTRSEDDWQQQADELVALASILQSDFRLTGGPELTGDAEQDTAALQHHSACCEQLQCIVAVHVDLPAEGINIKLSDSKDCDGACWRIVHLPPIIARITLPASYPSKDPPDVNLSAPWLTAKQITIIQDQLLNLWNEAVGVSICYTWVDWLQHDCLAHLSISDTIALEQGEADPQSMALVMDILQYNAAQKLAAFKQGTWTCGICFEELPGSSCVQASLQCGHAYCQDCMRQHCQLHVKEGSLEFLRCPQPDCKEPLDRPMVNSLLSSSEQDRLESVELERTLNHMADAVYCPRCSTISIEDQDNCAQCSKCFYDFCSLCSGPRHPGVKCLDPAEKLELMRHRMAGNKAGEAEFRKREAELQNLALIQKECKQCPTCGMAIQRSEGCNKMTCTSCGKHFCYKCGQFITSYDHFGEGKCILFDLDEIMRWEAQMAMQQMGAVGAANGVRLPQRAELMRPCRCPQCGRINNKEGNNNNIRCLTCQANFCYSCKSLLLGKGAVGRHFGPSKCKQHSAE